LEVTNKDSSRRSKRWRQVKRFLKQEQKECEKAQDSEDIECLVSEIEMLQCVLCLVSRKISMRKEKKDVCGVENFSHTTSLLFSY
jgi:hypothetical protein